MDILNISNDNFTIESTYKTSIISFGHLKESLQNQDCRIMDKVISNSDQLMIFGTPSLLKNCYSHIKSYMNFRYWFAIDAPNSLQSSYSYNNDHIAIALFTKHKFKLDLDIKNTKVPHLGCKDCEKNLKDWGGKKHLMNPKGTAVSDVWKDLYITTKEINDGFVDLKVKDSDNFESHFESPFIPEPILNRIKNLTKNHNSLLVNVKESTTFKEDLLVTYNQPSKSHKVNLETNKIVRESCIIYLENLKTINPNGSFDLIFADPPYNLNKDYNSYDDLLKDKEYINWCNTWLKLCVDNLKPSGSLVVLNIPKWSLEHAEFLDKELHFRDWLVWDALSTPKGKIMPAHYSLLWYSKSDNYTHNSQSTIFSNSSCYRNSCVKTRTKKYKVSNIWSDLHRIKHKKSRDNHPCQLPEKLMERIIKMFSNEQDLVFDPFCGAGTTAISCIQNNRRFITTEIDLDYFNIANKNINQTIRYGQVTRNTKNEVRKSIYSKKHLEVTLKKQVERTGRLPNFEQFLADNNLDEKEVLKLYTKPNELIKKGKLSLAYS